MWADDIHILAGAHDADGRISHYAEPVAFTMKARAPGDYISEPTLRLTAEEARNLMQALWEAGVRPAEYKDSRAEVVRMEAHLADLRRMAFDQPSAAHDEGLK